MAHPISLRFLGQLSRQPHLINFLAQCTPAHRRALYAIMKLRLWAHAHLFSAVLAYLIYQARGGAVGSTLLLMSLGSISFAVFEVVCGKYADDFGRAKSIRIGLISMAFLSTVYGFGIWLASIPASNSQGIWLLIMGQALIGIPLAFINGADTILSREVFTQAHKAAESATAPGDLDLATPSDFDSYCGSLKYVGLAIAASAGVLALGTCNYFYKGNSALPAALLVFGGTAIVQLWAIRYTLIAGEAESGKYDITGETNRDPAPRVSLRLAAEDVLADRPLRSWLFLATGMSGFLLYSKYHFELDAMRELLERAEDNISIAIGLAVVVGALQYLSSGGSRAFGSFDRMTSGRGSAETSRLFTLFQNVKNKFRGAATEPLDTIEANRMIGALALMAAIVILYLINFSLEIFGFTAEPLAAGVAALIFYSLFNFLRGFGQQLLKSVVARIVEIRFPNLKTAIVSLSTAGGGIAHVLFAAVFSGLVFLLSSPDGGGSSSGVRAFSATAVISASALLIIGVFAGSFVRGGRKLPPPLVATDFKFDIVQGSFFVCLVLSNILAIKLIHAGWTIFNAGALAYGLTFMFTDAVSEVYGEKVSKKLWRAGIAAYPVAFGLVAIAVWMPTGGESDPYGGVFSDALWPFAGSLCSFAVSQRFDIWAFQRLRYLLGEGMLWLRNVISTLTSQGRFLSPDIVQ